MQLRKYITEAYDSLIAAMFYNLNYTKHDFFSSFFIHKL